MSSPDISLKLAMFSAGASSALIISRAWFLLDLLEGRP